MGQLRMQTGLNMDTMVLRDCAVFQLRRDRHGAAVIKKAFSTRFVEMLATLWRLDSAAIEGIKSLPKMTTFSSDVFSNGFFSGVIDFAREFSSFIETDYLEGYEDDLSMCYVRKHRRMPHVTLECRFRRTADTSTKMQFL